MTAAAHALGTLTRLALTVSAVVLLGTGPAPLVAALAYAGLALSIVGGLVQSEADRLQDIREAEARGARREAEARRAAAQWAEYNRKEA